jgi:hypothetical protein
VSAASEMPHKFKRSAKLDEVSLELKGRTGFTPGGLGNELPGVTRFRTSACQPACPVFRSTHAAVNTGRYGAQRDFVF